MQFKEYKRRFKACEKDAFFIVFSLMFFLVIIITSIPFTVEQGIYFLILAVVCLINIGNMDNNIKDELIELKLIDEDKKE